MKKTFKQARRLRRQSPYRVCGGPAVLKAKGFVLDENKPIISFTLESLR